MPVPDFSPGEVLTASAMDSIGLWLNPSLTVSSVGGTPATSSGSVVNVGNGNTSVTVTCFNSTYNNYRIHINNLGISTTSTVWLRFGTSSNHYYSLLYSSYSATFANLFGSNTTEIRWLFGTNTNLSGGFDVFSPNLPQNTRVSPINYQDVGAAGVLVGYVNDTVQHTSFTLLPQSGSFTSGSIRVYGYRN